MIKVIQHDRPHAPDLPRCEHMVSHSGTGLTARPKAKCRKNAVIDFNGKRICQQHAGTLALSELMKRQDK